MKTTLIALTILTLLATSALFIVHHQNAKEEADLEFHIGKLHIKIDWNNLGGCASALQSACESCKAVYDERGKSVSGDIKCVKNVLSAKSCKHIF